MARGQYTARCAARDTRRAIEGVRRARKKLKLCALHWQDIDGSMEATLDWLPDLPSDIEDLIDWLDEAYPVRKLLGDEADAYIKVTESPVRSALANLPAKDLQRCGIAVADDVDAVVIKAASGDLDKLIDALINDQELEEMT